MYMFKYMMFCHDKTVTDPILSDVLIFFQFPCKYGCIALYSNPRAS